MKLGKNIKFNFVFYGCLILASCFLYVGAKSYFSSLESYNGITSEVKNAIKEMKGEEEEKIMSVTKPSILDNVNEKELINNYLYAILDNIITDDNISSGMIKNWNNFEIINTQYIREITDTYYSYSFDVKIHNSDAMLPVGINKGESKDDYVVITLIANISIKDNKYQVKCIDIMNS